MPARTANQLEQTRVFVAQVFADYEGTNGDDEGTTGIPFQETVLIRDGYYCGHRFSTERHKAVWFLEENQVKFFDADGKLLRVAQLDELPSETPVLRSAA